MRLPNSSTSSFKKRLPRLTVCLLACIVFFVMLCGLNEAAEWMLVDDTKTPGRAILNYFYHLDHLDTVFLGSSHTMYGIQPSVYDEIAGTDSYNLGTNSQYMDVTYYLLKEAYRRYHVKNVLIDCYYYLARSGMEPKTRDYNRLTSVFYCTDYFKPLPQRLEMIISACPSDYYVDALFPAKRYSSYFGDWDYITALLKSKATADYRNRIYSSDAPEERVLPNGHMYCQTALNPNKLYFDNYHNLIGDPESYTFWDESLRRIIDFCKEKQINLTLFNSPMTDFFLLQAGSSDHLSPESYDAYLHHIEALLEDVGSDAAFYDLNLCKPEYLDLTYADMRDTNHLNSNGAEKASRLLAELSRGSLRKEDVFYNSYSEKLSVSEGVFGMMLLPDIDESTIRIILAAQAEPDTITLTVNGGEAFPYDNDGTFISYAPETVYTIAAYMDGEKKLEIRYATSA